MRFRLLAIWVLAVACQPQKPLTKVKIPDIDSLIIAQTHLLGQRSIDKAIQIDEMKFNQLLPSNKLIFEMGPFKEVSLINKPQYNGYYSVTVFPDTQSNLTIKQYRAKNYMPIKEFRLYYLNNPSQLKRMEATLSTKDFYQYSMKTMALEFSLLGDTVKLESYQISGSQEYFWGSTRYFSVKGTILEKTGSNSSPMR